MRVGEILTKQGYVEEASIQRALEVQVKTHQRIGEILVASGLISEPLLQDALAFQRSLERDQFEDKPTFLRSIIPFKGLRAEDLERIASRMEWRPYGPGETILRQGDPGRSFYLIRNGLVKVFLHEKGKETAVGFLGEGDCFGEISLLTQGPATASIQTMEQTLCLAQEKADFLQMIQDHPSFHPFFNQLLTQRLRTIYKELLSESPGVTPVEPFLYRKQVREMLPPFQPLCREETTIEEATRRLIETGANALLVTDEQKRPKGVLGLRQILKSVLLEHRDPRGPAEPIMARDFYVIDSRSYFFDALHEMVKRKAHEMVVCEGEKTLGLLTGFDLLRFRGREVLSLTRNIENAVGFAQLNQLRTEVEKVLRALMTDGALASQACRIVSEFNDKIVHRVFKLVEDETGPAPCSYVWLGLGSEGRREQTLLTDQDNALLFSSPASSSKQEYFKRLAEGVVMGLHQCGFPLCKGGIMATHPKWSGGLDQWKMQVAQWTLAPLAQSENLSDLFTFLDFRAVWGDLPLERELRAHVVKEVRKNPVFLRTLARSAVSISVPLGFFKNFIVEKSGRYKHRLNLKLNGLVPLISCVKLLSWHYGMRETNTLERIRGLVQEKAFSSDLGEFLEQACETFLTLKIRNDLADVEQGKELSHHIDPGKLSTRQKQLLKEAFLAVSQLQKTLQTLLRIEEPSFGITP
jgi:CBS domain-containing protein